MRRAEGLAGLDRFAIHFLDHHDDPARPLAGPGFIDDRRLERQAGEPRAILAGLFITQVIRPNEVLGHPVRIAAIAKLEIGREWREELAGRNPHPLRPAETAEVELA